MSKKRLIITSLISIILVCVLFIGTTYSIFTSNQVDPNSNVYTTGNLDVTYTVDSNNIKFTDATPVKDEDVEDIKPYRITVNNVGNVDYKFNIILSDTTATNVINYDYIMTQVGKLDSVSLSNTTSNIIKSDVIVKAGSSVPIDVRVYLSDNVPNSEVGKNFSAKLSIDGLAVSYDDGEVDNSDLVSNFGMPSDYVMSLSNISLGSYVSMTPTKTSYTTDTSQTGYTSTQTINPQELNLWRVLSINNDKTLDIISEHVSSVKVWFRGQTGYQNFVGYLNVLASQYENSTYTKGSRYFGYNGQIEYITDASKFTNPAPWTCNTEGTCSPAPVESQGGGDILYTRDYDLVNTVLGTRVATNPSGTKATYWMASRSYRYHSSTDYRWGGRYVTGGTNGNMTWYSYYSSGFSTGSSNDALRPILTLKSSVYVNGGSGTKEDPYTLSNRSFNQEFDYTGNYQTYNVSKSGNYKIELWGAQGGSSYYNSNSTGSLIEGGKGGYTSGVVSLKKGERLYIYVGGRGNNGISGAFAASGYNGGGNSSNGYQGGGSGGGATDVRLVSGEWNNSTSLNSRIMVAGAGAGSSNWNNAITGGAGGNLTGGAGKLNASSVSHTLASGGTQISGGTAATGAGAGSFGIGGNTQGGHGGGGGSGFYGGGGGGVVSGGVSSGAGGSSYISGYKGCVAITSASSTTPKSGCTTGTSDVTCSYHYSGKVFMGNVMKSGSETMPNYDGTSTMIGNSGNGHAKITYVPSATYFAYTGSSQTFTASKSGNYKIELWGAQGGSYSSSIQGGKGGYTSGVIALDKGENLYVYVGGQGGSNNAVTNIGGYNGGGYSGNNTGGRSMGGGGATDIRLVGGSWNNATSLNSRIMVAGAGGGTAYASSDTQISGVGGNLTGGSGSGTYNSADATGGTQISGGTAINDYGTRNGSFGSASQSNPLGWGGGGGSGYYGGAIGYGKGGAGGSSYISGYKGCVAITSASSTTPKSGCTNGTSNISCSYHYSGKKFSDTVMKSGGESMPDHNGSGTMIGNVGDGYARITYMGR